MSTNSTKRKRIPNNTFVLILNFMSIILFINYLYWKRKLLTYIDFYLVLTTEILKCLILKCRFVLSLIFKPEKSIFYFLRLSNAASTLFVKSINAATSNRSGRKSNKGSEYMGCPCSTSGLSEFLNVLRL